MGKYRIYHNEGVNIKKIDNSIIEAHELRLKGKIAVFLDSNEKIIGLYPVKQFRIKKEIEVI